MSEPWSYGVPSQQEELDALARSLSWSFASPLEDIPDWLVLAGHDQLRVLRHGGELVAGLVLIPMGWFFGGRSVQHTGIAGVTVPPEQRGRGASRRLMQCTLEELRESGCVLSGLYSAADALYRGVGYERAGIRQKLRIPANRIAVREVEGQLREATPDEFPRLRELYGRYAAARNGHLDRGEYVWRRVESPRRQRSLCFVAEHDDQPEGYLHLHQRAAQPGHHDLMLTDMVATSARASRRLLAFLARHSSLVNDVIWCGSAAEPLLCELDERALRVSEHQHWMLRLVNVDAALRERGYPPGLELELHLDVHDATLPANTGRRVLRLGGGKAEVEPGGSGELRCDVRALAALYTGFHSARSLGASGLLEGPDTVLASADAAFAGPAPWMPDGF